MATAYDMLGIGPDATRAELERAYYQDKREAVTTFVRDQKISYPVLLDLDGSVGTV